MGGYKPSVKVKVFDDHHDYDVNDINLIINKYNSLKGEKKYATRKDIAERAGTSVSVVSRALNNSGYVEAGKKKKIHMFQIALNLKYSIFQLQCHLWRLMTTTLIMT